MGAGNTGNLASKNASTTAQTLASVSGLNLGNSGNGGIADNYNALSTGASSFTVDKKVVGLAGSKTYDGNATLQAGAGQIAVATGVGGESLAVSGSASANSKNASTNPLNPAAYLSDIGGISLVSTASGDAQNYTLSGATTIANITAKGVTAQGSSNVDKT